MPKINLSSISYGSDKLTVDVIRKIDPEKFERELPSDSGMCNQDISRDPWATVNTILRAERRVAELAYARAMEIPGRKDWRDGIQNELTQILTDYYTRCGLACSDVHALALISDIEKEAVAQARATHTKGPSHGRF